MQFVLHALLPVESEQLLEITKLYSRISGISYLAIQREIKQWHYAPSMYLRRGSTAKLEESRDRIFA